MHAFLWRIPVPMYWTATKHLESLGWHTCSSLLHEEQFHLNCSVTVSGLNTLLPKRLGGASSATRAVLAYMQLYCDIKQKTSTCSTTEHALLASTRITLFRRLTMCGSRLTLPTLLPVHISPQLQQRLLATILLTILRASQSSSSGSSTIITICLVKFTTRFPLS